MKSSKWPMLVRDFIQDRLYSPGTGYFTKEKHQLGQLRQPLRYSKFDGVQSYFESLGSSYPEYAFLTPVEIFQPWYGYSIAQYFLQKSEGGPIRIYEIGAGTGTAALSILDFYKKHHIQTYERLYYTLIELSPTIADASLYRLSEAHPQLLSSGRVQVLKQSAFDFSHKCASPCFVFALEVLDNLPHDLVFQDGKQWNQTLVNSDASGNLSETLEPINDPVIKACLELYQTLPKPSTEELEQEEREGFVYMVMKYLSVRKKVTNKVFLPTGFWLLLNHFHQLMPQADYLFADFDSLVGSKLSAVHAPIVQNKGKLSHEKTDFTTYLVDRGQADIMFPTDFRLIQHMHKKCTGKTGHVFKTHRFMQEFARSKWTETRSGYTPLLDDFQNTSVFLTHA